MANVNIEVPCIKHSLRGFIEMIAPWELIPRFKGCNIIFSANEYVNIICLNCRKRYEDIVHHSYVFCVDSKSDRVT